MYLWIWVCCFNPDEVANVFPHSGQAWLLAPTWLVRMCLCKLLGSVKTLSQFSQGNLRNSPCIILCLSKFGLQAKFFGQCSQGYCPRLWLWEKNENELIYLNSPTEGASSWFLEICKIPSSVNLSWHLIGSKIVMMKKLGIFGSIKTSNCTWPW